MNITNKNEYEDVRQIYKDGDWVTGIGKYQGCSIVFDSDTNMQPFSFLHCTNPSEFRLATEEEILIALYRIRS